MIQKSWEVEIDTDKTNADVLEVEVVNDEVGIAEESQVEKQTDGLPQSPPDINYHQLEQRV